MLSTERPLKDIHTDQHLDVGGNPVSVWTAAKVGFDQGQGIGWQDPAQIGDDRY